MEIMWTLNFSVCTERVTWTQPHSLDYVFVCGHLHAAVAELSNNKYKTSAICPFKGKVCQPLVHPVVLF